MKNQSITDNVFENNIIDSLNDAILPLNQSFEVNISNNIFLSSSFNGLYIKNKLVYIGKSDDGFWNNNFLNEDYFNFYLNIAKTGVGGIFTGGINFTANDEQISNIFKELKNRKNEFQNFTMQVHEFGVKIFYTLNVAYGRADSKNSAFGVLNYSASYNKCFNNINYFCKKLSDGKCDKIVDLMANQALYALESGFDGVMIDGDLFGIVGEFTSSETNRRKFGYYNELEDMPKNIINKILAYNRITRIFYKITLKSLIFEIYGAEKTKIYSAKYLKESFTFDKILVFLNKLIKLGVDGFLIKFGTYETEFLSGSTSFQKDELFKKIILKIDEYLKINHIKNKFGNDIFFIYDDVLYDVSNDVTEKDNFLIDFSKQILADNRVISCLKNKQNIINCIKCGLCESKICNDFSTNCILCQSSLKDKNINTNIIKKNANYNVNNMNFNIKNTKIAVIGAGISGINAAIFLHKRGFLVDLYEKNSSINLIGRGGEIFGYNYLLKSYNDMLEKTLSDFVNENKLNILLNTEFNKEILKQTNYSKIIVATGFHTKFSTIPGAVLSNVKNIYEVLNNESFFCDKNKIVIEAKTELSLALAQYLLLNNKKVTLLFPSLEDLCKMQNSKLTYYLYSLKKLNCNVILFPKICRIETDFVELLIDSKINNQDFRSVILNYRSKKKYKIQEQAKNIDLDTYIYEPEIFSNNKLYIDLVSSRYDGEIFLIGNALYPCDFIDCIKSAYFVSKNI